MKARTSWVDYAKAIGIILVVYGHVARGLYNSGIHFSEPVYALIDSVLYSFHMPLFFFLSGLFFYDSFAKRGGVKLAFSKVDTIFYPYVLWSILQGGIEVFLSNYTNGNVTFTEVFSLLWAPRAQFWFLYALFFVFIASAIFYSMGLKRFSALFFVLSVVIYLVPGCLPDYVVFNFISQNLVFFTFGIMFTMYAKAEHLSTVLALCVSSLVFIAAQYVFHAYFDLQYSNKGIGSLLLACVSIFFVVSLSLSMAKASIGFLAFIGQSSMAIYLMHILAGSGARVVLSKLFGINDLTVHLVVGCLVGMCVPLVALLIINRMKIPFLFSAPVSSLCIGLYEKVNSVVRR